MKPNARGNISHATGSKRKSQEGVQGHSNRPHKLHTKLTASRDAIAAEFCRLRQISLNDLFAMKRELGDPAISLSGFSLHPGRGCTGSVRKLQPWPGRPPQGDGTCQGREAPQATTPFRLQRARPNADDAASRCLRWDMSWATR